MTDHIKTYPVLKTHRSSYVLLKLGSAGALPPCGRGVATPRNTPLPTRVIVPNLVVLGQTVRALLRSDAWKIWPLSSSLSRSLKVTGTDTDRSATCDFLLMFHRWAYLVSFPRKTAISVENRKFSYPVYLTPPLKGFLFELVPAFGVKVLEW